jgi:Na+/melibiose symporter-like transporter
MFRISIAIKHVSLKYLFAIGGALVLLGLLVFLQCLGRGDGFFAIGAMLLGVILILATVIAALIRAARRGKSSA